MSPAAVAQDELTDEPGLSPAARAGRSAGGGATVIFTNVPGAPASSVPGLPGVVFDPGTGTGDFDRVYGSPNGNWILTCFADLDGSEDELLFVNGSLVQQEGRPGPWTMGAEACGALDQRCSVNDSGDFTFATNTDGPTTADDYIVTHVAGAWGFVAREGDPIATLPGNAYGDQLDSPLILADGSVGFAADGVTDNPDTLLNAVLVLNGTDVVCREGDPVDLDGNGLLDDDTFINTFGNDDAHLADDGTFYMVVTLKDGTGSSLGQAFVSLDLDTAVGASYCTAVPNSTGAPGVMGGTGSAVAAANDLTLTASSLPANQFGVFAVADTQGFAPGAGGTSNGNLCLTGSLGRFVGPGQILSSGAGGEFSLSVDLTGIPQGAGTVAVMAGDTWNFQAWHRDVVGLGSNFTDGDSIAFR